MESELAPGKVLAVVGAQVVSADRLPRGGLFRVEKFHAWQDPEHDDPWEVLEFPNNYTNAGGSAMLDILIGSGTTTANQTNTYPDNGHAYIGVGDSTTAFAASQTDLQAATNKLRKAMDATYPSRSGQVMTWRSTFATTDANFSWQEIALFNASSGQTMFARKVQDMGTKTSAAQWVASYTFTWP